MVTISHYGNRLRNDCQRNVFRQDQIALHTGAAQVGTCPRFAHLQICPTLVTTHALGINLNSPRVEWSALA